MENVCKEEAQVIGSTVCLSHSTNQICSASVTMSLLKSRNDMKPRQPAVWLQPCRRSFCCSCLLTNNSKYRANIITLQLFSTLQLFLSHDCLSIMWSHKSLQLVQFRQDGYSRNCRASEHIHVCCLGIFWLSSGIEVWSELWLRGIVTPLVAPAQGFLSVWKATLATHDCRVVSRCVFPNS